MLVYHAFADVNHGVFRAFVLHRFVFGESIELDYWRILDFLYLFPHKADAIRVPQPLVSEKRRLAALHNKYNDVPFPREFLAQTRSIHASVAGILGAKGLVSGNHLEHGILKWASKELPEDLTQRIKDRAKADEQVLAFLRNLRTQVPATGQQGIKARSGWMEHRYDA